MIVHGAAPLLPVQPGSTAAGTPGVADLKDISSFNAAFNELFQVNQTAGQDAVQPATRVESSQLNRMGEALGENLKDFGVQQEADIAKLNRKVKALNGMQCSTVGDYVKYMNMHMQLQMDIMKMKMTTMAATETTKGAKQAFTRLMETR